MQVAFKHQTTGQTKFVKVGFSWTMFLFSPFYGIPQFMRGLTLHGAALVGIGVLSLLGGDSLRPLFGIILIAAMIFYGIKGNELTAKNLMAKGWAMDGNDSAAQFARAKWGIAA